MWPSWIRDLGQTVYFGLSDEDEPVLINFADTIVMESMSDIEMDTFYYSEDLCRVLGHTLKLMKE